MTKPIAHQAEDKLPSDSKERKEIAIATGVVDYFPDALIEIAKLSWVGNDKHNPGEPLHWSRPKSNDHSDCLMRHFVDRGKVDSDGIRHSVKVAWRALALLQLEIEKAAIEPVGEVPEWQSLEESVKNVDPAEAPQPRWTVPPTKFRAPTLDVGDEIVVDAPSGILHCSFGKAFPNGTKGVIVSEWVTERDGDFAGVQFEKNGSTFAVLRNWLKPTKSEVYTDDYRQMCMS